MPSRVIGESFGAYTAAAVEGLELDQRREYNDCDLCDLTLYGRCNLRAWGGSHPAPTHKDEVMERKPWTCTREYGHTAQHVACCEGDHECHVWSDSECLPGGASKMLTARLLVEAAELNMPGKFVRRPPLEQLMEAQDKPEHLFPVDREEPRPEGGVTLFIFNKGSGRMTGVDVTEEFSASLPVLYITEGDLMSKEARERGESFLNSMDNITHWTEDIYQMVFWTGGLLTETCPTPGGQLEQVLKKTGEYLLQYEKTHFMAS